MSKALRRDDDRGFGYRVAQNQDDSTADCACRIVFLILASGKCS
jgi:hypothetical protein